MFNTIMSNISEIEAKKLHPNKYMILLVNEQDAKNERWIGDIIFIGTSQDRRIFSVQNKCPDNHTFLMVTCTCLEQLESGSVQPVTPLRLESA